MNTVRSNAVDQSFSLTLILLWTNQFLIKHVLQRFEANDRMRQVRLGNLECGDAPFFRLLHNDKEYSSWLLLAEKLRSKENHRNVRPKRMNDDVARC